MRCAKCGADNREGRKFCTQCGSPLVAGCPRCGAATQPGEKFCGECGAVLATPPATQTKSDEPQIRVVETLGSENLEGERKTITVLFADIKGSMSQIEDLDPEAARAIVDPALAIMAEAVNRYQGHVAQSTGDGVFALFGAPIAHEDHPQRAIYAALRMQEELRLYSDRLRAEGKAPVEIRIGINTGEVVMRSVGKDQSHSEYLPAGHAVGLASRLQTIAPTGSIALSEQTRRLVEGYFRLKSLGPTHIKGMTEAVTVYEVIGLGPLRTHFQLSARRGWTRFVGRETEMEAIARAAGLASSAHGQILGVVAEAGVGKSRLFYEFKVRNQSAWMTLEAYSTSHGKTSAYLPVIDLLHSYFAIAPEDDARTRREKVMKRLLALDSALQETFPYLFRLLEIIEGDDPLAQMDSQIRRRRTLDAIKRILLRESLNQPLMVTFEDLHWTDGETLALLNLLADSIGTARILMLVNYRPEHRHDWGNKSYYTQLGLNPLGKDSADQMLSALLGEGTDLKPLKTVITRKTEGNPFFIEEIVQALFEQGVLARNGTVKLAKAISEIGIPATVQGVLAARIDRLPPDLKELLQTLAVIGKEFALTLVREVTAKAEEALERPLADLQLAEFIYERPSFPDTEYVFKHALTQDVAYNSVLIERRKDLHERTAAAIEAFYAERLDHHLSALAHHYSHTRNSQKAIHYLRLAGVQAAERSANLESVAYFKSALDLLRSVPDSFEREGEELDLLLMLGPTLMTIQGHASVEAESVYLRAREICQRLGDDTRLFPILFGFWLVRSARGETGKARELAGELVSLAESLDDDALKIEAHHASWNTLWHIGELQKVRFHAESGVALYDPRKHRTLGLLYSGHDPGVCGHNFGAQAKWLLGYPDRAVESNQHAVSLAHELAHPESLCWALIATAMVSQFCSDSDGVKRRAQEAIEIATEHGFAFWLALGTVLRCWAINEEAPNELEVAKMQHAIASLRDAGALHSLYYYMALAAESCAGLGRNDEARAIIAEALDLVNRTGERWHEPELHRLKGELLLGEDAANIAQAEQEFRTAIELAREPSAKSWELRATTSLAQLLAKEGKRDEARAMLTDIYDWFTEGFDTADLKDAKALLNALN